MDKPVGRMNLKPVVGENLRLEPDKVLRQLKRELHNRIKLKIQEANFSQRAKRAFSKAVTIRVMPRSLMIMTNHPGFVPMLRGRESRQMRWLTKAKHPIPIFTDTGELIFRWATPRSMANGKWVHPGRKPSNFIEAAKKEAREFVKEKISKEVLRHIRAAMQGQ